MTHGRCVGDELVSCCILSSFDFSLYVSLSQHLSNPPLYLLPESWQTEPAATCVLSRGFSLLLRLLLLLGTSLSSAPRSLSIHYLDRLYEIFPLAPLDTPRPYFAALSHLFPYYIYITKIAINMTDTENGSFFHYGHCAPQLYSSPSQQCGFPIYFNVRTLFAMVGGLAMVPIVQFLDWAHDGGSTFNGIAGTNGKFWGW